MTLDPKPNRVHWSNSNQEPSNSENIAPLSICAVLLSFFTWRGLNSRDFTISLKTSGVVLNQEPLELQSSILTTRSLPHSFLDLLFFGGWGTDFSATWKGESWLKGDPLVSYKQCYSFHWEQIPQCCYFFVQSYNLYFCQKSYPILSYVDPILCRFA